MEDTPDRWLMERYGWLRRAQRRPGAVSPQTERARMSLQSAVLPSLLRGMVGMVTPGLRAVFVRFGESDAYVRFVYDHEPTEVDIEDVDDVEAEMIADLHPEIIPHLTDEFDANRSLCAQVGEIIAFKRKEPAW